MPCARREHHRGTEVRIAIHQSLPIAEAERLGRDRILGRIIQTRSGCWEWQGFRHHSGYGAVNWRGKPWRVHRLAYRLWKGEIPAGLDVCHACDNKPCCNPDHLWAGDQRANSLDVVLKGQHTLAKRTHCRYGHSYAEHGARYANKKTWRECKACGRARARIRAGWPIELAYSLPVTPHGFQPAKGKFPRRYGKRVRKENCLRGHPLSGENLYMTPTGSRRCRACHRVQVMESAKRCAHKDSDGR